MIGADPDWLVTAMRRSELVALNVEGLEFNSKGALVTIQRSKTDQETRLSY